MSPLRRFARYGDLRVDIEMRVCFVVCRLFGHIINVPTGESCFDPLWCGRCLRDFDADSGKWVVEVTE